MYCFRRRRTTSVYKSVDYLRLFSRTSDGRHESERPSKCIVKLKQNEESNLSPIFSVLVYLRTLDCWEMGVTDNSRSRVSFILSFPMFDTSE